MDIVFISRSILAETLSQAHARTNVLHLFASSCFVQNVRPVCSFFFKLFQCWLLIGRSSSKRCAGAHRQWSGTRKHSRTLPPLPAVSRLSHDHTCSLLRCPAARRCRRRMWLPSATRRHQPESKNSRNRLFQLSIVWLIDPLDFWWTFWQNKVSIRFLVWDPWIPSSLGPKTSKYLTQAAGKQSGNIKLSKYLGRNT